MSAVEEWFDTAVEDELAAACARITQRGGKVSNLASLRDRIRQDLEEKRGTVAWGVIKAKYEQPFVTQQRWCCVCDKPVRRGRVTAWLEDHKGNTFCSQECQHNTERHPISYAEWKERLRAKGKMTTRRWRDSDLWPHPTGVPTGEEICITWEDTFPGEPRLAKDAPDVVDIDWDA